MIVAHGNSLRALKKYLDNISDADIIDVNIPTGIPLVYDLDDDLRPIGQLYLGDPETVKAATAHMVSQTVTKKKIPSRPGEGPIGET